MIAKLSGLLDFIGDDRVVIDVGGVGYLAFCSGRTLRSLPGKGAPVQLFIETHVREDHIHLYGFADEAERDWFQLLQTVQGVGARVALALLSVLGPAELAGAIAAQDKAAVSQANGVGGKLASRIVSELRGTVGDLAAKPSFMVVGAAASAPVGGVEADAVSALVNLGYKRVEATMAVAGVARRIGENAGIETLIRAGLRELGQ